MSNQPDDAEEKAREWLSADPPNDGLDAEAYQYPCPQCHESVDGVPMVVRAEKHEANVKSLADLIRRDAAVYARQDELIVKVVAERDAAISERDKFPDHCENFTARGVGHADLKHGVFCTSCWSRLHMERAQVEAAILHERDGILAKHSRSLEEQGGALIRLSESVFKAEAERDAARSAEAQAIQHCQDVAGELGASHEKVLGLVEALKSLRIDANRLCDRNLGGTYEADCRRSIVKADAALAAAAEDKMQ